MRGQQVGRPTGNRLLRACGIGVLWAALLLSLLILLPLLARYGARRTDLSGFNDPLALFAYLELGALFLAAAGLIWLTGICTLLLICATLRSGQRVWTAGERLLHAVSPKLTRNLLATALGVGISATALAPAHAATETDPFEINLSWAAEATVPAENLGLQAGLTAAPEPSPAAEAEETTTVTVRAGDSLWKIAQRQLPDSATNTQIDAAWRQWYDLNAEVIGADPDLIYPGMVLVAPE